ncbi:MULTISPECIES: hypothetical protein [Olivibacter]|jgi:hypothetical protein|uniref:Phosphatidate cytidylyltransferase n=3 Tax=Sphingobacteriaceae TaxID=84566 RepID=F4C837_SPHS2|nr:MULTISPECIES: hypothetical protein [Olivibacter]MCL4641677.1 hypothetical protein [Olivibacter sp. UJ_SKK_5.1]MDM8177151.1 hypothetical protein [Olivibacter sp. 47]MDX3912599.1 hypothetical protein [Pseudosphingobacterium sp.]
MSRSNYIIWPAAIILLTSISSCDFIAGVFKGGVYVGVFLVIIVIAIIVWLISKARR